MSQKQADALLEFLGMVARFFLYNWLTFLLWNSIAVNHFSMPNLTFWQIVGLNLLCGFIFKSWSPYTWVRVKKEKDYDTE